MNKHLIRFVAVLLVPTLVVDPVLASIGPLTSNPIETVAAGTLFSQQALMSRALHHLRIVAGSNSLKTETIRAESRARTLTINSQWPDHYQITSGGTPQAIALDMVDSHRLSREQPRNLRELLMTDHPLRPTFHLLGREGARFYTPGEGLSEASFKWLQGFVVGRFVRQGIPEGQLVSALMTIERAKRDVSFQSRLATLRIPPFMESESFGLRINPRSKEFEVNLADEDFLTMLKSANRDILLRGAVGHEYGHVAMANGFLQPRTSPDVTVLDHLTTFMPRQLLQIGRAEVLSDLVSRRLLSESGYRDYILFTYRGLALRYLSMMERQTRGDNPTIPADLKTAINLMTYFLVLIENSESSRESEDAQYWLNFQLSTLTRAAGIRSEDWQHLKNYYASLLKSYVFGDTTSQKNGFLFTEGMLAIFATSVLALGFSFESLAWMLAGTAVLSGLGWMFLHEKPVSDPQMRLYPFAGMKPGDERKLDGRIYKITRTRQGPWLYWSVPVSFKPGDLITVVSPGKMYLELIHYGIGWIKRKLFGLEGDSYYWMPGGLSRALSNDPVTVVTVSSRDPYQVELRRTIQDHAAIFGGAVDAIQSEHPRSPLVYIGSSLGARIQLEDIAHRGRTKNEVLAVISLNPAIRLAGKMLWIARAEIPFVQLIFGKKAANFIQSVLPETHSDLGEHLHALVEPPTFINISTRAPGRRGKISWYDGVVDPEGARGLGVMPSAGTISFIINGVNHSRTSTLPTVQRILRDFILSFKHHNLKKLRLKVNRVDIGLAAGYSPEHPYADIRATDNVRVQPDVSLREIAQVLGQVSTALYLVGSGTYRLGRYAYTRYRASRVAKPKLPVVQMPWPVMVAVLTAVDPTFWLGSLVAAGVWGILGTFSKPERYDSRWNDLYEMRSHDWTFQQVPPNGIQVSWRRPGSLATNEMVMRLYPDGGSYLHIVWRPPLGSDNRYFSATMDPLQSGGYLFYGYRKVRLSQDPFLGVERHTVGPYDQKLTYLMTREGIRQLPKDLQPGVELVDGPRHLSVEFKVHPHEVGGNRYVIRDRFHQAVNPLLKLIKSDRKKDTPTEFRAILRAA